jgi:hypothetical protein
MWCVQNLNFFSYFSGCSGLAHSSQKGKFQNFLTFAILRKCLDNFKGSQDRKNDAGFPFGPQD